jgi:toxin ParE1/3/4
MSNRARKTPQTEIDLMSIYNFIADDSLRAAEAWLARVEATFDMLAETPMAGRARNDLGTNVRSFSVGNYVIFYRPIADGVEVVRVIHGRRDIDADDMM